MIVLDCSAVLTLCFEGEDEEYADRLFNYFSEGKAMAPEIWPLEVCNALLSAVKRRRLKEAEANHYLYLLSILPVQIVSDRLRLQDYAALFELAARYNLSAYDTSYLALALDRAVSLATRDRQLTKAAEASGVEVFV